MPSPTGRYSRPARGVSPGWLAFAAAMLATALVGAVLLMVYSKPSAVTTTAAPDVSLAPFVSTTAVSTVQLAALADKALAVAGYRDITVTVEDGFVWVEGVVSLDAIETGFFRHTSEILDVVADVEGMLPVRSRLGLRGDAGQLRRALTELTAKTPIVFDEGSLTLTEETMAALDEAALVINSQPGLTVLIAGHTDSVGSASENERIGRERGLVVHQYLVARGVAPNRLSILSYGELSMDGSEPIRRVELEVGP